VLEIADAKNGNCFLGLKENGLLIIPGNETHFLVEKASSLKKEQLKTFGLHPNKMK